MVEQNISEPTTDDAPPGLVEMLKRQTNQRSHKSCFSLCLYQADKLSLFKHACELDSNNIDQNDDSDGDNSDDSDSNVSDGEDDLPNHGFADQAFPGTAPEHFFGGNGADLDGLMG